MIEQDELSSLPSVSNLPPETPWEEPAAKRAKITPEATSTPAVAGLRPKETQEPEKSLPKETQHPQITPRMRLMISEAIARGIAAGMQQNQQEASDHTPHEGQPPAPDNPRDVAALPRPLSPAPSMHSQESLLDDEEPQGSMQSEDKGGTTDTLGFTGLFNPALFKTLLHRAKATARIEDSSASDPASGLSDPNSLVFSEPTTDNEEIPSPKLFLDVIQQQWDQPGRYPGQSMTDKQFYNVAPNLTAALEMPTIDKPVAALACADIITNNLDEALNAEDRRAEVSLRKAYNSAAWAIKAATAASFFNRTSVLWLKEMQARIPATDLQAHQALNNLVMAAEYSADATLNSAKFASRSIFSSVTARRLLWLRYWQATVKFKWKLATAPFKGGNLFGEALEPVLIETEDKKKVLRSMCRRPDRRSKNTFSRAANTAHGFSQPQGAYFQPQDRQSNRRSQNPSFTAADTAQDFSQPQGAYFQPRDRQSNRWSQNPSFTAADTADDFSQPQGAYFQPQDRQSNRWSQNPSFTAADTADDFSQPQGAYFQPQDRQSNRWSQNPSFTAVDTADDFSQPQGAYFQHQDRQSDRPGNRGNNRQQFQSKQSFQGKGNQPPKSVHDSVGGNDRRSNVADTDGPEHRPTRRRSRFSPETPKVDDTPVGHSSDSRPTKTQQASSKQEHQTAAPPVHTREHPGGRHPDVNRSDRSIPTPPYVAGSSAIPMVLVHEPGLPVQDPPVQPVFSNQNIRSDPSNSLGSPQDYPYSRPTLPERHIDPNHPPPANRRPPLHIPEPAVARILTQLRQDLILAYRQSISPRSTNRQDSRHSLPAPGPPGQHQNSGEPDPRRPPLTNVRQGGVVYRHPSLDTSAYQGRAGAPPALPEMWPERYNYRSSDPIRRPPVMDVSGHNQGRYVQKTEPARYEYGHQSVRPRSPQGDPDDTWPVVTGGCTKQHQLAPCSSPERRRSQQDSYQRPREQPPQDPRERRRSEGRTGSSTPARRR
ncbi:uncharacterized protein [Pituophis catenifer annectens]|uniref:uncharacterized protein n=1 Tax=Pituophis catenifer annectens TaxID=94852 RepID=UPI0039938E3D